MAFLAVCAPQASAAKSFSAIDGYDEPSTPERFDKVGILKVGRPKAENVLVLNPGTSASAAYFAPLARQIVAAHPSWQVWSVERRENLLEDHSTLNRAKRGEATGQELFDYYLGWVTNPLVLDHFQPVADTEVPFARRWGMEVAVNDLRRVVELAANEDRTVVLGGHSLGGTITIGYATWDFGGEPGATGLDGLVLMDGGSPPSDPPPSAEKARADLDELERSSPFLDLAGIGLPWAAGVFNATASTLAIREPDSPSLLQEFALTPSSIKAPVRTTNEAAYGYYVDSETGPESFSLIQMHLGHLAEEGDPRGWVDGELVEVQRAAEIFSATRLEGLDGSAWYHPRRLTIDGGSVNAGVHNEAQDVLGVRSIHGADLSLPIYGFGARGGTRILQAARSLARQSEIPRRELVLVNRAGAYAHCDPLAAAPRNDFTRNLGRLFRLAEKRSSRR